MLPITASCIPSLPVTPHIGEDRQTAGQSRLSWLQCFIAFQEHRALHSCICFTFLRRGELNLSNVASLLRHLPPAIHLLKTFIQLRSRGFDRSFRHPVAYFKHVILKTFHDGGCKYLRREIRFKVIPFGSSLRI